MPGVKGRSGGKRAGAGRPPAPSVKGRRVTQGQKFLYREMSADNRPYGLGQMATITHMTRTLIVLTLEDGSTRRFGY